MDFPSLTVKDRHGQGEPISPKTSFEHVIMKDTFLTGMDRLPHTAVISTLVIRNDVCI